MCGKPVEDWHGPQAGTVEDSEGEYMLAEEALAYAEAVREHCREFYIYLTVSTLVGLHGVSVEARDLALELGVSLKKAKVLGLSEYDMQNLTELAEYEPKLKEGK